MTMVEDLAKLADTLNALAALYQFRSLDDRLYGALTVSQSYCLRILYFQGPRAMGELAADLDVRLSTMTGVIDQLEDKALVARVDHPHDRRSLRVKLTPRGRKLYHDAHAAFLSHLAPLFGGRTAAARGQILEFLADAIRVVKGWREHPRKVRRHHASKNS
jgi:DNA-binding MarR family transcriptional regulator